MAALLHLDPSTREDARAKAPPSRRRARAGLTLLAALVVLGVAVAQGDGTVLAAGLLLAAAAVRLLDGGAGGAMSRTGWSGHAASPPGPRAPDSSRRGDRPPAGEEMP
ncbi:hypothetical protein ACFQY4_29935 [Catellatospora bangladeshensis]|uniref:DUF3040 domain-containing protein n=1 Tax=Catellatospora bangladeshensis TaxID=310355 RepID=A0A8J3JMN8_9ACTN|nr:hypothetical protein [Catellatospora bangladeshensis]GIF80749.1 hypothetical protein Cba03nite_20980 [Catellatospora bangladeshensis]